MPDRRVAEEGSGCLDSVNREGAERTAEMPSHGSSGLLGTKPWEAGQSQAAKVLPVPAGVAQYMWALFSYPSRLSAAPAVCLWGRGLGTRQKQDSPEISVAMVKDTSKKGKCFEPAQLSDPPSFDG